MLRIFLNEREVENMFEGEKVNIYDIFDVNLRILLEETLNNVRSAELRIDMKKAELKIRIHVVIDIVIRVI